MMRVDVVTIFPDMVLALTRFGVTAGASERGALKIVTWNPRDYTSDVHRSVDDRPYGGGPGMVMRPGPLHRAILASRASLGERKSKVVYLSPQGAKLNQQSVRELVNEDLSLILVAGRYEGIDERVIELIVDEEWSIGDYVLAGGELAAMVMIEAMARCQPGVLGNVESAENESFETGLLDHCHYTRPDVYEGLAIPDVLKSGDHNAIAKWREDNALQRTKLKRPDLLNADLPGAKALEKAGATENAHGVTDADVNIASDGNPNSQPE